MSRTYNWRYLHEVRGFFPQETFAEPEVVAASCGYGVTHGTCLHYTETEPVRVMETSRPPETTREMVARLLREREEWKRKCEHERYVEEELRRNAEATLRSARENASRRMEENKLAKRAGKQSRDWIRRERDRIQEEAPHNSKGLHQNQTMSDMQFTQTEYPSEDAWRAEGRRRFGDDVMKWRFVCPVCKTVQTPQDYKDAGAKETAVAFSCVGRWNGLTKGCNYAGGGLFRLNPVHIEGHQYNVFDFAPDPAGQTATQVLEGRLA